MTRRRSFWIVQAREARVHAAIIAVVLWTMAVVTLMRPGPLDLFGNLKGGDFVHFYTLGHAAVARDAGVLYDGTALHARQAALVPASADAHYIPVYPPQTGLIFAPFTGEPYFWAAVAWAACVIGDLHSLRQGRMDGGCAGGAQRVAGGLRSRGLPAVLESRAARSNLCDAAHCIYRWRAGVHARASIRGRVVPWPAGR